MSGCTQGDIIYLDNNATTPLLPEVKDAITEALQCYGNPSSLHRPGRQSRALYEKARGQVASAIGAKPEEVIFTSSGTEANNLAIMGYCLQFRTGHIITTMIEHPSVMNPIVRLQQLGYSVSLLRPDSTGIIDPEKLRQTLRPDTILVSIMHANNETGAIQPIEEISRLLKDTETVFHVDAAQSIGKIPVDVATLGVDMLTIVPHKFHGPKGIGALYVKKGIKILPLLYGASQERGLSPGTENLILASGFGRACSLLQGSLKGRTEHLRKLTEALFDNLVRELPEIKLNTGTGPRLPNTLNVCIPGVEGHRLVEALRDRVAFSTGSACHEGRTTGSEVLLAMGISSEDAICSVRLSTGMLNTLNEMSRAATLIAEAAKEIRSIR